MTLPAKISDLATSLEQLAQSISADADGLNFMKFTKQGEWLFGSDELEAELDATWAVNPKSFIEGFQAWGEDNELLGEEFNLLGQELLLKSDLPEIDGQWKRLVGFQMVCLEGEHEGITVLFKGTSKGTLKEVGKFVRKVVNNITPEADGKYVPVVTLGVGSYKHGKYGKIFTPTIDIEKFISGDGVPEVTIPESKPQAEEEEEFTTEPIEPEPQQKRQRKSRRA